MSEPENYHVIGIPGNAVVNENTPSFVVQICRLQHEHPAEGLWTCGFGCDRTRTLVIHDDLQPPRPTSSLAQCGHFIDSTVPFCLGFVSQIERINPK